MTATPIASVGSFSPLEPLGTANHLLFAAAQRANIYVPPETIGSRQRASNTISLLPTAQAKLLGNAVITERIRPMLGYEVVHNLRDCHARSLFSANHLGMT